MNPYVAYATLRSHGSQVDKRISISFSFSSFAIDLIKSDLPKPGLDKRLVGIPEEIRALTIGLASARVTFTRLLEIVIC